MLIRLGREDGSKFSETVREHFLAINKAKHAVAVQSSDEEGDLLCETLFSLAYGALLITMSPIAYYVTLQSSRQILYTTPNPKISVQEVGTK